MNTEDEGTSGSNELAPVPGDGRDADGDGDGDGAKQHDQAPAKDQRKKKNRKRKKKGGGGRGIETMFRVSYRTHLELSQLADTKANIMISLNGIIITILISSLSWSGGVDPLLLLPAAALLVTGLVSLVYSILAARPRITSGVLDGVETSGRGPNVLFFGNFVRLEKEVFVSEIQELMAEPQELYAAMARDLYGLGSVLDRKYRLISTAYTVFMTGLTIAVGLFVAVLVMTGL